jgi:hypothetical protein
MFNLKRGDIQKLSDASGVPHETVRRYVHGGNVSYAAGKSIDLAMAKLKPVQAAKKKAKSTRRASQRGATEARPTRRAEAAGRATVSGSPKAVKGVTQ